MYYLIPWISYKNSLKSLVWLPFIATKLICRKTTITCIKFFVAFAGRKLRKIHFLYNEKYAKFVQCEVSTTKRNVCYSKLIYPISIG
jgi:hypothetical protein